MGDEISNIEFYIPQKDSPRLPIEIIDSKTRLAKVLNAGDGFLLSVFVESAPAEAATPLFTVAGVIVDVNTGEVIFQPTTENTDITPATYYHSIRATYISPAEVTTIAEGALIIKAPRH